jgi:alkanesulfonate monooxygenase SsuD/methylene tetrahydromethanopterin reductase-like flavin-dependent oxidoreductase (luciferase family)
VKFGLFLDMRNPPGWKRPWTEFYRSTLDRLAAAEQIGLESVWLSEHHFFEDGYLPQPLTMAAAVAARTSKVRIGTAIVLGALRHPIHLAEEAALVDVISGGRFELGLGAGYSVAEYGAFGVDLARRFSLTDDAVVHVREALANQVMPPPVQQPLPLWLGYQGPQGARRAGRLGVGLLSVHPELLEPYREGLTEGGHDPDSARMGGVQDIIVADDPEQAEARILPFYAHQLNTYRAIQPPRPDGRPLSPITVEKLAEGRQTTGRLPGLTVLTPADAVLELRRRLAGLPIEHVYAWASIAGMPDDLADRHVELWCTQVAPALRTGTGASDPV